MRANRKSKKTFSKVLLLLVLALQASPAVAAGLDRGIMRVTFLYAIETTGGRGELLRSPVDISFDRRSGELYVADPGLGAILIYDANGVYLNRISVNSVEGSPMLVATDGAGRIYIGHNNSPKISVLNYKGEPLAVLDLPGIEAGKGALGVRPLHLAGGGPDGAVYALKSRGGMVGIDPEGAAHKEIGIAGKNTDEGPNQIFGFSVDQAGRFLFSDMRPYSVVRYDREQQSFERIGTPGVIYGLIARPAGIAIDGKGHIFVTSTVRNKVLCYDETGEFVEEFGGLGKNYGQFYQPGKIASDGGNRLFVLEVALKRVQVFEIEFLKEQKKTTDRLAANAGAKQ